MGSGCNKWIETSKQENEKYEQKDGKKDEQRERNITFIERRCPCTQYRGKGRDKRGKEDYPCETCNHSASDHF